MSHFDPANLSNYESKLIAEGKISKIKDNAPRKGYEYPPKAKQKLNIVEHVEPTPTDTELEQHFLANEVQGIEQAYFSNSFGSEIPDYTEQVGAKFVKTHNDDGIFIGSLPMVYPYVHHEELDSMDLNKCRDWKLSIPSFCNTEGLVDLINQLVPENTESLTWKTIKEINKLADEIDTVPEAKQLIQILSDNYKDIPEQIKGMFSKQLLERIIPNKEPEYDDLSAYLNAPFPKLKIKDWEENPEVKDILSKLDNLALEDLNIPLVQVNNSDLTERDVGGAGVFDHIANSIFNQLDFARKNNLITQTEIAEVYKTVLVQGIQTAAQFTLEKANILNQSYGLKLQAVQSSVAVLQAKAELLMLPIKIRMSYAELDAKLKEIELLKVQINLEKEKFPQVVAQTDLILAQTDSQRLQNEQIQVGIQTSKLQTELTKVQLEVEESSKELKVNLQEEQVKQLVLTNNQTIEQTKLLDSQNQYQLKQVKLADIQMIESKAKIKMLSQQLEKEKENLGLIKAQTAAAVSQLSLIKDQLKATKAQYSDTIDGKPVGGLLGAQIAVNKVQASSYERKAFMEVVSNLQSGWAANKTADIAISSPTAYTPMVVDRALTWGMTKYFNMPNDIMQLPAGYTPYLSDDEMDAKQPVTYKAGVGK